MEYKIIEQIIKLNCNKCLVTTTSNNEEETDIIEAIQKSNRNNKAFNNVISKQTSSKFTEIYSLFIYYLYFIYILFILYLYIIYTDSHKQTFTFAAHIIGEPSKWRCEHHPDRCIQWRYIYI